MVNSNQQIPANAYKVVRAGRRNLSHQIIGFACITQPIEFPAMIVFRRITSAPGTM